MSGARFKNPTLTRKQATDKALVNKRLESRDWIQRVLGEQLPGQDGDDLQEVLGDGVVLCRLANKMFNNCIPKYHPPTAMPFQLRENIVFFLTLCKRLGLPEQAIFNVEDLYSGKKMANVYSTLQTLSEMATSKGFPIPWIFLDQKKTQEQSLEQPIEWVQKQPDTPKQVKAAADPVKAPAPVMQPQPVQAQPQPQVASPKAVEQPKKPVTAEDRYKILETMLNKEGANPDKLTPLHVAVQRPETIDIVDYIIKNKKEQIHAKTVSGQTPLHYAVMHNNKPATEKLIAAGADVNVAGNDGETPLSLAVQHADQDIVNILLNSKADLNHVNHNGETPLHVCITEGSEENVVVLVNRGANLNVADKQGNTPLHNACSVPLSYPTIKLMLDKGANPMAVNNDKNTPLHLAAETCDVEIVNLISKSMGKNLNQTNKSGNTALHVATLRGNRSVAQKLVAGGADVNAKNADNNTALQLAVEEDSTEMVEMIMTAPTVDINSKTNDGWTPLYTASWRGNINAVKALLKGGANPNMQNKEGWSPLHAACAKNHLDCVQELLANNAQINIQDNQGTTPLYHACDNKADTVALYLITVKGIDVNLSGKDHWKPVHAVARRGLLQVGGELFKLKPDLKATVKECQNYGVLHLCVMASRTPSVDMLRLLVDNGADVNQQNVNGMTPLHLACCVNAMDASKFLVEYAKAKLTIKNTNGRKPVDVACYFGLEEMAMYLSKMMGKKCPKILKNTLVARPMDEVQPSAPPTPENF